MVLSYTHLFLIAVEDISILGILANWILASIQLGISEGLNPGLIATITLDSLIILSGSFHLWNCLRESLPIK